MRWVASRLNSMSTSHSGFWTPGRESCSYRPPKADCWGEGRLSFPPLFPPPSVSFTLLFLCVSSAFLFPQSIATNYSCCCCCCILLLIVFFQYPGRSYESQGWERLNTEILNKQLWCQCWIDVQGHSVQRYSKGKHEHKVVTPAISTWVNSVKKSQLLSHINFSLWLMSSTTEWLTVGMFLMTRLFRTTFDSSPSF